MPATSAFAFPCMGLSFPYTGPVKSLHAWHMFSPGMNSMQFGGAQEAPIALSYDKETMLACLLDEVKSDHVDLLSGTECTGLQPAPGGIVVETAAGPSMCTYLIAADGTNSRIVEQLGYNNNRRHIANLYAKSFFIQGFNSPHGQSIVTAVSFLEGKPVYLFLLPRPEGDAWNLLVLTLEGSVDLQAAYETLVKTAAMPPGLKTAGWCRKPQRLNEFILPLSSPLEIMFLSSVMPAAVRSLNALAP